MRGMKNTYKILVGITEGKRPLGRPIFVRWEDNMNLDIKRSTVAGSCEHGNEHST
jgi:hypothetical protein